MKFIKDVKDGENLRGIYYCKHKASAMTKNGKPYESVILQDKTGTLEGKIWDPNSAGIGNYEIGDFIEVCAEVIVFSGQLQAKIDRVRVCSEDEYKAEDYMPVSKKDINAMYDELLCLIDSIKNKYYKTLLESFFKKDTEFIQKFKKSSAAKMVHHGFIGGLLEHTLSVTKLCDYYTSVYPALNRDLLLCAAMCHDIGKTRELSCFPENDYTDEGQFLGHIVMGSQMIAEKAAEIEGFPKEYLLQLQHCILAHHGKYEYGSPKLPSIIEALALNYADDTDAKLETFTEILENNEDKTGWLGYNRLLESNLKATIAD